MNVTVVDGCSLCFSDSHVLVIKGHKFTSNLIFDNLKIRLQMIFDG